MRVAPLLVAALLPACTATTPAAAPPPPAPTASATGTPTGTPTATPSVTPSVTPSGAARPVPRGFSPHSVSFVSESHGWALGAAGRTGAVAETRDGGRTWTLAGTLPVEVAYDSDRPRVWQTRFLSERVGWAYGTEAYVTRDGGATWREVTIPGGRQLRAIDAAAGRTYALLGWWTSDAAYDVAVWKGTVGGDTFTRADPASAETWTDEIVVNGRTVLFAAGATARISNDGGRTWATRTPCPQDMGVQDAAAVSEHEIFFACTSLHEHDFRRSVRLSRDGGRTTVNRLSETGWSGARIAGTSPARLVRALDPQGSEDGDTRSLQWSSDAGRTFHRTGPAAQGHETPSWEDLRFHTATFATVVRRRSVDSETYAAVYATRDGGRTWVRLPLG